MAPIQSASFDSTLSLERCIEEASQVIDAEYESNDIDQQVTILRRELDDARKLINQRDAVIDKFEKQLHDMKEQASRNRTGRSRACAIL